MNIKKLFTAMLLCAITLPMAVNAQKKDDSRYLQGAVPEVNGKVVFSKEFLINGMSKDEVYNRMLSYITDRMAKNNDPLSRVAYTNKEEGSIVALSNEWVIFSSGALSLDRTKIKFQFTALCSEGKCNIEISKISYTYRETEKYQAEEWITDKYALNKTKTKLVMGLAKWRRKTVDLFDDYNSEIEKALSAQPETASEKATPPASTSTGIVVIQVPQSSTSTQVQTTTNPTVASTLHEISPVDVQSKMTSAMCSCKVVLYVGEDADDMTIITAKRGISIGFIQGKPAAFAYLDAQQQADAITSAKSYIIKIMDPGTKEVKMVLHCKPISSTIENGARVVTGEILSAESE